jgi:ABC-2 type transport system permease protein
VKRLIDFSWSRWWSILLKEFLQLRRDRLTFGMIVGVPLLELALFGYAINNDPKHLPTAVITTEQTPFTRSIVASLMTSDYFDIVQTLPNEEAGHHALATGDVQFVLNIPSDFSRKLLRGERPVLLVEADATDPSATGNAISALTELAQSVATKDLTGPLSSLAGGQPAFDVQVQRLYNPEGMTQYNIIPGLMGTILTMTLVMMTALAITRERERGTMENPLATPVRPIEVMTGKLIPYVVIGLIQSTIIVLAARYVFHVPFVGSVMSLYVAVLLFISSNLTVGITLSSFAQNQLQAMQMSMFYFMPNVFLSGFLFPFRGMPGWAQAIGSVLPLTYFNRLTRGILLKGNGWHELWPSIWPLLIFTALAMTVAVKFYRKTLD